MMNWSIFAALVLLSSVVTSAARRVTRVINGELVLGRTMEYKAVRYYAAIGTLHGVQPITILVYTHPLEYGELSCGGALITPRIIQTACHCLSYAAQPASGVAIQPAKVVNSWEDIMRVYIGANDQFGEGWSMANIRPLVSKKFVLHESCSYLPQALTVSLTHDFGWIIVDGNWDDSLKDSDRIDFAPLYTQAELENTFRRVNRQISVCLRVGFGPYVKNQNLDQNRMRHGWSVVLPETKCSVYSNLPAELGTDDLRSWVCFVPFSKHFQPSAHGDSGSPVSCDNQYFAVLSSGVEAGFSDEDVDRVVNYDHALNYVKFQNTKEARRAFIHYMDDYAKSITARRNLPDEITFQILSHSSDSQQHRVTSSISSKRTFISSAFLTIYFVRYLIKNS